MKLMLLSVLMISNVYIVYSGELIDAGAGGQEVSEISEREFAIEQKRSSCCQRVTSWLANKVKSPEACKQALMTTGSMIVSTVGIGFPYGSEASMIYVPLTMSGLGGFIYYQGAKHWPSEALLAFNKYLIGCGICTGASAWLGAVISKEAGATPEVACKIATFSSVAGVLASSAVAIIHSRSRNRVLQPENL